MPAQGQETRQQRRKAERDAAKKPARETAAQKRAREKKEAEEQPPSIVVFHLGGNQEPAINMSGVDPYAAPSLLRRAAAMIEKKHLDVG